MRIRLIGVGSPHGDDALGWVVAGRLAGLAWPPDVEVRRAGRPPLDWVEGLQPGDAALLVDAVRSGAEPGSLRWLAPEALREGAGLSSHGLGVREAVELARGLGRLPRRLEVLGVELATLEGDGLSPAVAAAVGAAVRAVCARVEAWRRAGAAAAAEAGRA